MNSIVEKARAQFFKMVEDFGSDPYGLLPHVPEAEKWARFLLKKYPQADEETVLLAVWLHDLGHYPLPTEADHAARGEQRARDFLERENYPEEKMGKVLHCVRSHRNKDVLPESLEAKIMAFADSTSHMTTSIYFDMAQEDKEGGRETGADSKIERDFRDLSSFPEIKKELAELYAAWKALLKAYGKIDLK